METGDIELLPRPGIDLTLEEYARMLCALLDVPVYDGLLVESVHALLGLFLTATP